MNDEDILSTAAQWLSDGHKVALGTVVKTWGSAPRPAGSQIAADWTALGFTVGHAVATVTWMLAATWLLLRS